MKILVTGNRGFIGSHMAQALLNQNHNVVTHEWGESEPDIRGFDWLIHMGAISSTVERDVEKVMRQNVDNSIEWLEECIKHKVNMQFSSSASIYGRGTVFVEDANPDPQTPYAWSKYLFERHVQRLGPLPIRVQMFRYFNVFGSNEDHKGSQASPYHQFTQQAKNRKEIIVFEGSDRAARDFIPVSEVIDTQIKFFDIKDSGVYNVGTGNVTTFLEIAEAIAKTHDARIRNVPMPESIAKGYQWYTCADMSKTQRLLNALD